MTSTISETAAFMHQAHKMGVSHFNMNMSPIDRDQFDKTFDFPVDLYAELYDKFIVKVIALWDSEKRLVRLMTQRGD